jgi:hypothetical protein
MSWYRGFNKAKIDKEPKVIRHFYNCYICKSGMSSYKTMVVSSMTSKNPTFHPICNKCDDIK